MTPEAPHIAPNVPLADGRPDLTGSETICPVRERDGSRCTVDAGLWTYGHTCTRHAEQLRRGRKLVLVNGTRLDRPWSMPGRFGWWVKRDARPSFERATDRLAHDLDKIYTVLP